MFVTPVPPDQAGTEPLTVASAVTVTRIAAGQSVAVSYQGTNLVVDGIVYPRASSGDSTRSFAPGRLLLSLEPSRAGELDGLMSRLGLHVERALGGEPPIGWVINVPAGFELQWQAALKRQPAVRGADLDGRMAIQPVTPIGPGLMR